MKTFTSWRYQRCVIAVTIPYRERVKILPSMDVPNERGNFGNFVNQSEHSIKI